MADDKRVSRGFDLISHFYDFCVWLVFQDQLMSLQREIINGLQPVKHCLIVGGGTGKILRHCLDKELAERFTYAEISPKMIEQSKARLNESELQRVKFVRGYEQAFNANGFNLVIFPFVLDCFSEDRIQNILTDLKQSLTGQGRVVVIDFNHEPIEAFRPSLVQRMLIQLLYGFFHLVARIEATELPKTLSLLEAQGFSRESILLRKMGWVQASTWRVASTAE